MSSDPKKGWVLKIYWKANVGRATGVDEIPIDGTTTTKEADRLVQDWRSENKGKSCTQYQTTKKES